MFQQGGTAFVSKAMDKVFQLWKENKIKPVVDSTWALEDVRNSKKFRFLY